MRADRPPQAPPRLPLPLHSWGRGGPGGGGGGDAKQMASQAGPRLRGGAHSREWSAASRSDFGNRAVNLQPPVYLDPPKPWPTFRTPGGP